MLAQSLASDTASTAGWQLRAGVYCLLRGNSVAITMDQIQVTGTQTSAGSLSFGSSSAVNADNRAPSSCSPLTARRQLLQQTGTDLEQPHGNEASTLRDYHRDYDVAPGVGRRAAVTSADAISIIVAVILRAVASGGTGSVLTATPAAGTGGATSASGLASFSEKALAVTSAVSAALAAAPPSAVTASLSSFLTVVSASTGISTANVVAQAPAGGGVEVQPPANVLSSALTLAVAQVSADAAADSDAKRVTLVRTIGLAVGLPLGMAGLTVIIVMLAKWRSRRAVARIARRTPYLAGEVIPLDFDSAVTAAQSFSPTNASRSAAAAAQASSKVKPELPESPQAARVPALWLARRDSGHISARRNSGRLSARRDSARSAGGSGSARRDSIDSNTAAAGDYHDGNGAYSGRRVQVQLRAADATTGDRALSVADVPVSITPPASSRRVPVLAIPVEHASSSGAAATGSADSSTVGRCRLEGRSAAAAAQTGFASTGRPQASIGVRLPLERVNALAGYNSNASSALAVAGTVRRVSASSVPGQEVGGPSRRASGRLSARDLRDALAATAALDSARSTGRNGGV